MYNINKAITPLGYLSDLLNPMDINIVRDWPFTDMIIQSMNTNYAQVWTGHPGILGFAANNMITNTIYNVYIDYFVSDDDASYIAPLAFATTTAVDPNIYTYFVANIYITCLPNTQNYVSTIYIQDFNDNNVGHIEVDYSYNVAYTNNTAQCILLMRLMGQDNLTILNFVITHQSPSVTLQLVTL